MFDFATASAEDASSLTPLEQQEEACNVMILQLALYAELVKPHPDAPLSPEERQTIFLVASNTSPVGEA